MSFQETRRVEHKAVCRESLVGTSSGVRYGVPGILPLLPANEGADREEKRVTARLCFLGLLHARYSSGGRRWQDLRIEEGAREGDDEICTMPDWLEHIAWLLGKSPLSRNPEGVNPATYSVQIMFFGDYGNRRIPSTIDVRRWVQPYIWAGLVKTHNLLGAIPADKTARLLAARTATWREGTVAGESERAAAMIGNYLADIQEDWDGYRSFAFSQE